MPERARGLEGWKVGVSLRRWPGVGIKSGGPGRRRDVEHDAKGGGL